MKRVPALIFLLIVSNEIFSRGELAFKRDNELAIVYIILTLILSIINFIYTLIKGEYFDKNNILYMAGIALILTIIYAIALR